MSAQRSGLAVYVISVAARSLGTHPQTLRAYERLGFLTPARSAGGVRLYSDEDLRILTRVIELSAQGVSLAGVRMIIALEAEVARLQGDLADLRAGTARAAGNRAAGNKAASNKAPGNRAAR